jgi:hypothetical protein
MGQLVGTGSVKNLPISRGNKRRKFGLSPAQSRVASCPARRARTAKNSPRRRPRLRLSRDVSTRAAPTHVASAATPDCELDGEPLRRSKTVRNRSIRRCDAHQAPDEGILMSPGRSLVPFALTKYIRLKL